MQAGTPIITTGHIYEKRFSGRVAPSRVLSKAVQYNAITRLQANAEYGRHHTQADCLRTAGSGFQALRFSGLTWGTHQINSN